MRYLLLFLAIVAGVSGEFYSAETLTMDVGISTRIQLLPQSSDYYLDELVVNMTYVPEDSATQSVERIRTEPEAVVRDGHAVYRFDEITGVQPIRLDARVRSSNHFEPMEKVSFPVSVDMDEYLEPQEIIDMNPAIIAQASGIVEGEDDLYSAVYHLGVWVRENINYSLSTFTADASKPASWVLENRYGVCDELTSLFIAMCRSVGIPARYVSGVAYTNYRDMNEWGPHAWAEVYFPGYGWIPFDVTYGQFGFTDSTHVILKRGLDAGGSSITYSWKGRDVDLDVSKMEVDTQVVSEGKPLESLVDLTVEPLKESVSFGSYNLVRVTVTNTQPYYLISTLQMGRVTDITLLDDPMRFVLLKPNEERDIYWRVKVRDDLDKGYVYTVPLLVQTLRNQTATGSFRSEEHSPEYSEEWMDELHEALVFEEKGDAEKGVNLSCEPVGRVSLDEGSVDCKVTNTGNTFLSDMKLCLDGCEEISLGISQSRSVEFDLPLKVGAQEAVVRLEHDDVRAQEIISYVVHDEPRVSFVNVSVPDKVSYDDTFVVAVTVKKDSYSVPQNLNFSYHRENGDELSKMHADSLDHTYTFKLRMKGKDLFSKNETFYAQVRYEDDEGEVYSERKEYHVQMAEISWWQRFMIFLNKINSFVI